MLRRCPPALCESVGSLAASLAGLHETLGCIKETQSAEKRTPKSPPASNTKKAWNVTRFFEDKQAAKALQYKAMDALLIDDALRLANEELTAFSTGQTFAEHKPITAESAIGVYGSSHPVNQRLKAHRAELSDLNVNEVVNERSVQLTNLAIPSLTSSIFAGRRRGDDWFCCVLHKHGRSLDEVYQEIMSVWSTHATQSDKAQLLTADDFSVNMALDDLCCSSQLLTIRATDVAALRSTICEVNDDSSNRMWLQPIGFTRDPCDPSKGAATGQTRVSMMLRGMEASPKRIVAHLQAALEGGFLNFYGAKRFSLGSKYLTHHMSAAVEDGDYRAAMWMMRSGVGSRRRGIDQKGVSSAVEQALTEGVRRQSEYKLMFESLLTPSDHKLLQAAQEGILWNMDASLRWRATQLGSVQGDVGASGDRYIVGPALAADTIDCKWELLGSHQRFTPPSPSDDVVIDENLPEEDDKEGTELLTLCIPTANGSGRTLLALPEWNQKKPFIVVRERPTGATNHYRLRPDNELAMQAISPFKAVGPGYSLRDRTPEGLVKDAHIRYRGRGSAKSDASGTHCAVLQFDLPAASYLSSFLRNCIEFTAQKPTTMQTESGGMLKSILSGDSKLAPSKSPPPTPSTKQTPVEDSDYDNNTGNVLGFKHKSGLTQREATAKGLASGNLTQGARSTVDDDDEWMP